MAADSFPRFIFIGIGRFEISLCAYRDEFEGIPHSVVVDSQDGVLNPHGKIEVEPAKHHKGKEYFHLRFCHANKYWAVQNTDTGFIVAESNEPQEDTSLASCTLFEPIMLGDRYPCLCRLTHVSTKRHTKVGGSRLLVSSGPVNDGSDVLSIVDSEAIVRLPEHVAFRGDNNKYLQAVRKDDHYCLKFSSDDPNDERSGFRVELRPYGYIRIKSDFVGKYWDNFTYDYITAGYPAEVEDWGNFGVQFRAFKVDSDTVAIRSNNVEASLDTNSEFEWGSTTTTTTSVKAKYKVRVPAKSRIVVHYVGTKGTRNIPFTYHQEDRRSTDCKIVRTVHHDGTYTGVSCYDFNFEVQQSVPLDA